MIIAYFFISRTALALDGFFFGLCSNEVLDPGFHTIASPSLD